jgi:hypothetical protein
MLQDRWDDREGEPRRFQVTPEASESLTRTRLIVRPAARKNPTTIL